MDKKTSGGIRNRNKKILFIISSNDKVSKKLHYKSSILNLSLYKGL